MSVTQSDASELLGGFRPVQLRHIITPLAARFELAFVRTFSRARNAAFLDKVAFRLAKGDWKKLLALMQGAIRTVCARNAQPSEAASAPSVSASKRQRTDPATAPAEFEQLVQPMQLAGAAPGCALGEEWARLCDKIARLQKQLLGNQEGVAFTFVEGTLVRALREGHWLLLDEINLAAAETLERVAAVLEEDGSVVLAERGEAKAVVRHDGFRIFGAMNPPTDFGKKELPPGIRSRFTELYVTPITSSEDLHLVVIGILQPVLSHPPVSQVVDFYHAALHAAETTLLDGANQRPQCAR